MQQGQDSVIACVNNDSTNRLEVVVAWNNPGYANPTLLNVSLSLRNGLNGNQFEFIYLNYLCLTSCY